MIDDENMLSTCEHQSTGYNLWSLCGIGSKGKRIDKLFGGKKRQIWEKETKSEIFIFNYKYEMWLSKSYTYTWSTT